MHHLGYHLLEQVWQWLLLLAVQGGHMDTVGLYCPETAADEPAGVWFPSSSPCAPTRQDLGRRREERRGHKAEIRLRAC